MKIEHAVMFGKLRCAICCSLLLWLAAACGGGGGSGGSGGTVDATAPGVAAATPASGSSGASRIADLRVTLSEAANVWFSGDDVQGQSSATTYDVNGNPTGNAFFNGPGVDGIWLTEDDDVSSHTSTDYDRNGNATRTASYQGAGADGELFTGG